MGLGREWNGRTPLDTSLIPDFLADTASPFNNDKNIGWLAEISYALLRDVREPVEQMRGMGDSARQWDRVLFWRRTLLHRAATFYGTSSSQYRAAYAHAEDKLRGAKVAAGWDIPPSDVLPRWKHIQSRMSLAGKPYEEQTVWRSIFH